MRASGSRQLFEKRMERIYLQNRNQEYHSGCSFVGTGSYQCMGDEYGNETYAKSYEADFTLEDTEELLDEGDTSANADKKDEAQETKDKKFSFSEFLNNAKDKVDDAIDAVGEVATEKLSVFEDGLNRIIEGVAVLLVTTCAIPVLVMLSFTWILKGIMGLKIPSITLQSVPRVSERKRKKTEEN